MKMAEILEFINKINELTPAEFMALQGPHPEIQERAVRKRLFEDAYGQLQAEALKKASA